MLESQILTIQNNHMKVVDELQINLAELQNELDAVRNDKFFLQRLSADLKMSLQGTLNQNKVINIFNFNVVFKSFFVLMSVFLLKMKGVKTTFRNT